MHAAQARRPAPDPRERLGYGPSQLQSAYNLTSASAANGTGRTIAIVDAFDDPTAAADLATYRSSAGLPPVPSFKKINQNGATSPLPSEAPASDDWTLEESLDLDMASAICPLCNIVLVEATNDSGTGLDVAENAAAAVAGYISNSWGGNESASDTTLDSSDFNHPGDVITASAGDSDFGVIYPATSPNVVAVGGTRLSTASNARGWTESVWNTAAGSEGTGSGCSSVEPQPSWQAALGLTGCSRRIDNDVAADADPATGVAVYDTSNGNGGWNEVGGTSASSPMLAAMYALAGSAGTTPAQDIYTHTSNFFDVTTGNDGSCTPAYLCTAETGYDGPTGIGTPNGVAGLVSGAAGNTVTVTNPGSQTGTVGTAVSLQIHASDSAAGQTLTYRAAGLPAGLSISSAGLISGTPTTAATSSVAVTATDTTGASGAASFTWTISSAGGGTCTTHTQLLGNPGFETGSAAPWTSTAAVINPNSAGETSHTGTWYAWLDGYGTTHTDTLSQTVTIPAGCTATSFSFWLHIDTAETTTTTQFDKLTITANGTTVATFSNLNHNTGYAQHTVSLGSLAGSSFIVKFSGTEDPSLQTSFVIDDTAITPN
jgi:subtilase family serine protease